VKLLKTLMINVSKDIQGLYVSSVIYIISQEKGVILNQLLINVGIVNSKYMNSLIQIK
jgi:hypothetical protein